ncbi:GNAT family N-acetyltransferase [Microbacterium sp. A93]|uniref:GNAT family N-acetyltransferase n=1 Tax=Microbacterium sp. A93 TaxID=3450716 RepID=UPI003F436F48
MGFERDLGDGISLALRTPDMARAVRPVAAANLDRLRQWEPWAHWFDPDGAEDDWNREQLQRYIDGRAIPTVLMHHGRPIGSVSAQLDRYSGTGELGYWLDADMEGRGIAQRACQELITDMFADGIARVEIRTAVHNVRSIRLAERLGFEREGTLRSALPVGDVRHDMAVFGLLPG